MVVQKEFVERAHRIVWCTVATVGPDKRPRSRILHPIWELDDELVGWIVTRATPIKVRHLAYSPYVSCSYWEPGDGASRPGLRSAGSEATGATREGRESQPHDPPHRRRGNEHSHEVAVADCEAEWVTDTATRQRVWELYRDAPEPLGYDFWSVFPDGPSGESPSLLRITPYRL